MLKFVFLFLPYADSADQYAYVVQENLTGAQCIQAVKLYVKRYPDMPHGIPACEIDFAQLDKGN